ncbi:hypothetical protein GCM10020000_72840 [Streptomyces olivoverticillatus]
MLVSSGVIVAAAVAVFFIAHNNKTGEIFLQSATAEGKDPFTASTAKTPPSSATANPTPHGRRFGQRPQGRGLRARHLRRLPERLQL